MSALRTVLAPNASPMTLDGTRTFLVGRESVAVIDPGPELPSHLEALGRALDDAREVAIVLTHHHPDHAAAGPALARRLSGRTIVSYGPAAPSDGDVVATDSGDLIALATPGHTPDHCALHWPAESAIFCGDLMMGGLDTALVAAPEGNLSDYLESLERLAKIAPKVVYPTHGPQFSDPADSFRRYRAHREERLRAVLDALQAGRRSVAEITTAVYGEAVDMELRPWLEATTLAYLDYLAGSGLAGGWHDE